MCEEPTIFAHTARSVCRLCAQITFTCHRLFQFAEQIVTFQLLYGLYTYINIEGKQIILIIKFSLGPDSREHV